MKILWTIVAYCVLLALHPGVAAFAAIVHLLYALVHKSDPATVASPPATSTRTKRLEPTVTVHTVSPQDSRRSAPPEQREDVHYTGHVRPVRATGYTVPAAPPGVINPGRWIGRDEVVSIQGLQIATGYIYVGNQLTAKNGRLDPCLIDPDKPVDRAAKFTDRHTSYWPSYADCTPAARGAYLAWLAHGKCAPNADIGYVFMYFYGLERRILVDSVADQSLRHELPSVAAECRRLLGTYGPNNSFRGYCSRFLNLIEAALSDSSIYKDPLPALPESYELPFLLRLALGKASVDNAPIPDHLALAWVTRDPQFGRRTVVQRDPVTFRKSFYSAYRKLFGEGIKITPNKTKLRLDYTPASGGFTGLSQFNLEFDPAIPDVTVLTGPVKKLQLVFDTACEAVGAYSRFITRTPGSEGTLQALALLDVELWPENAGEKLAQLRGRVSVQVVVESFADFVNGFQALPDWSREQFKALSRVLRLGGIGVEPDVLAGARMPKPAEMLAIFRLTEFTAPAEPTPAFLAAITTLELGAAVAHADGDFAEEERRQLERKIESWSHLTLDERTRLNARMQLLVTTPVSLNSLKARLEQLDQLEREALGNFCVAMANADGVVKPEEVRQLEKIYALLGLDRTKVYTGLHAGAGQSLAECSVSENAPISKAGGFGLDRTRIEALQADTARVTSLLSGIFAESTEPHVSEPPGNLVINGEDIGADDQSNDAPARSPLVLGLDAAHSALVHALLSRASWSRAELIDLAHDRSIMLDGALEKLNGAAFDLYDFPLTEGDDPVDINPEFLEKIAQCPT